MRLDARRLEMALFITTIYFDDSTSRFSSSARLVAEFGRERASRMEFAKCGAPPGEYDTFRNEPDLISV